MDRCVQRLRRRLTLESWQKHSLLSKSTGEKLGERVPSFFASPSLANLGGLGITDQPTIEGLLEAEISKTKGENVKVPVHSKTTSPAALSEITINSGWAGMGLHGNRSSGNLARNASDASGLFIEEEEPKLQAPGEGRTEFPKKDEVGSSEQKRSISDGKFDIENGYLKTSSMAKFYYRRTGNSGSTGDLASPSTSAASRLPGMVQSSQKQTGGQIQRDEHVLNLERRKSKSFTDFSNARQFGRVHFEPLKE